MLRLIEITFMHHVKMSVIDAKNNGEKLPSTYIERLDKSKWSRDFSWTDHHSQVSIHLYCKQRKLSKPMKAKAQITVLTNNRAQFPLAPMGVLGPGSAQARPSARPPIDTSGNFSAHMSGGSGGKLSDSFSDQLSRQIREF